MEPLIVSKGFVLRLFQFRSKSIQRPHGFIPEVTKSLEKYDLISYLNEFVDEGTFPSKMVWKKTVKSHVLDYETNAWWNRMLTSRDFELFRSAHSELTLSNIWRVAQLRPDSLSLMQFLAKQLCKVVEESDFECDKCLCLCRNELYHRVSLCRHSIVHRTMDNFITKLDSTHPGVSQFLSNTLRPKLLRYILGYVDFDLSSMVPVETYPSFLIERGQYLKSLYM